VAAVFLGGLRPNPRQAFSFMSEKKFPFLVSVVLKVAILLAATTSSLAVWKNLRDFPRTEDAEVRANVAGIAPQVSGSIARILVTDNQSVKKGDLLFELDSRPYEADVEKARAKLELVRLEVASLRDEIAAAEASLAEKVAREEYATAHSLRLNQLLEGQFISPDKAQKAGSEARIAAAAVLEAEASVERAKNRLGEFAGRNRRIEEAEAALRDADLRLSYCKVFAPCDGTVADLQISPGAYANQGEEIFSIVDTGAWFVLANFRETDLSRISTGQKVKVYLMADRRNPMEGIVEGIPRAVFPASAPSRASVAGEGVLSKVDPTFDFIQLAQRFPVRIYLPDKDRESLRMGGRAAVVVDTLSSPEPGFLQRLGEIEAQGFLPPVKVEDDY
jgi:membrane fusion protein, multidrug efflux system